MIQRSLIKKLLLFIIALFNTHFITAKNNYLKTKSCFDVIPSSQQIKQPQKTTKKINNFQQISKNNNTKLPTKEEFETSLKILLTMITLTFCFEDKTIVPRMIAQDAVSYLFHEFGHAITAKWLWNNPISIGLGASQPNKEKSLFKTNFFTLESLYPAGGYSRSTKPQKLDPITGKMVLDKKKQTLMLLAGGIFGAFGHIICNTIHAYRAQNPVGNPCSLKNICYDYGIAEQLLENVLIPNNPDDGYKNDMRTILEDCYNIKTPKALGKIHPYMVLIVWGINLIRNSNTDLRKEKEFFVRKLLQLICVPDTVIESQK